MPRYCLCSVRSGNGVPRRDHRINTTMSVSDGGTIASWKWPDASIGSNSQRIGVIWKYRAYSFASFSITRTPRRRSGLTSLGEEKKILRGFGMAFRRMLSDADQGGKLEAGQ